MLQHRPKTLWQGFYRRYAVRDHVTLGENVHIGMGSELDATVGLTVGRDVYIGKGCTLEFNGSIGDGVMIANRVGLVGRRVHDVSAVGRKVRDTPSQPSTARWN